MPDQPLLSVPHDLVPLICNSELRRRGFAEHSLDQIVLGLLWLNSNGLDPGAIVSAAESELNLTIRPELLTACLERIASSIKCLDDGKVTLGVVARQELDVQVNEFAELEDELRRQFQTIVTFDLQDAGERTWDEFVRILILPMVQTLGVLGFDHIFFRREPISRQPLIDIYLGEFDRPLRERVRARLDRLTRPSNASFRAFVLKLYGALFAAQSAGLSAAEIESIQQYLTNSQPLRLFLDTNVLFSFLGLRDHNSNSALDRARELIIQYQKVRPTTLYFTPETLDEARSVLASAWRTYQNVRVPQSVGKAAKKYVRELGTASVDGIVETFITKAEKSPEGLTAEEYFGERIRNLVLMARQKGVELYNTDLQGLADKVETQNEAQRMCDLDEELDRPRPKNFQRALHDAVLRRLVKGLRGEGVESPLESTVWLVTLDMRLLLFERDDDRSSPLPCCIHPSGLIQLLEYWLPRSKAFEDALLESFRLPVVLRTLDKEVEQSMSAILEIACSWAEGRDLPPEAAVKMFLNEELQRRVRDAQTKEEAAGAKLTLPSFYDLIQDEISEQYRRLSEKAEKFAEKAEKVAAVENQVWDLSQHVEAIEVTLAAERLTRAAAEAELQQLKQDVALRKLVRPYLASTALTVMLLAGIATGIVLAHEFRFRFYGIVLGGLVLSLWGTFVARSAVGSEIFAQRRLVRAVVRFYRSWWVLLLSLLMSLLATLIFESSR